MPGDNCTYVLSAEADQDLDEIYDFILEQFGSTQAVIYLTQLDELLEPLCHNPEMGRERTDIRDELRSMVYNNHVVFYRVLKNHLHIVRVLHGSRDIPKFLN